MSGNRLVFITIFLIVFILMMTIGLVSGVSPGAGVIRALLAATFFTALSFGTLFLITRYVIDDIQLPDSCDTEGETTPENENTGQMLDIMVSDPSEKTEEEAPAEPSNTNAEDIAENIAEDIAKDIYDEELSPLVTKQIDPNVEKVINSDPKRMADIIKKMGFED